MDWEQEAVKAQEKEKLAIQYGQMYQGKPWLHVAVDGGWQKQSHEHSYSSFPGKKIMHNIGLHFHCPMVQRNNFIPSSF